MWRQLVVLLSILGFAGHILSASLQAADPACHSTAAEVSRAEQWVARFSAADSALATYRRLP